MQRILRYLQHRTWLLLALSFMALVGGPALAAVAPSFSASASGTLQQQTIMATILVSDADAGRTGNLYLAATLDGAWIFHDGNSWQDYQGGTLPVYARGPLTNRTIDVVRNTDLSTLRGIQLYVGYGRSEADMLNNSKFAMVYAVTGDSRAPYVSDTSIINGTSETGINVRVDVTFNEAMRAASINAGTFMVMQGTTPVAGTISVNGSSATFIPSEPFAYGTTYIARIIGGHGGVTDLAGNILVSDYSWSWTTAVMTAGSVPIITAINIANGATEVDRHTTISATFSETMLASSVNSNSFIITQGTTPVPGSISLSGNRVTFTPTAPFAPNTAYTAVVKSGSNGVKDLSGNSLAADNTWSWTTAVTAINPDSTAPMVDNVNIANGATQVALNTAISATFSEPMQVASVNSDSFSIRQGTTPVSGTIVFTGSSAVFTPSAPFLPNTTYTALIKSGPSGAKDLAGNALAADNTWSWTTAPSPTSIDTTAPQVSASGISNGATNVNLTSPVSATFTEAMNPASLTSATFGVTQGSTVIPGTISLSGNSVTFTPSVPFVANTTYTATIQGGSNGARDMAGNPLVVDQVWSWTTAAAPVTVDSTAPLVGASGIANGATNISVSSPVSATFTEAMNPASLTSASFIVTQGGSPVAGTVSLSGNSVTFTPSAPLAANTVYTATIKGGSNGARDLAGNALQADQVWSWTTAAAPVATANLPAVLLGTAGNFTLLAKTGISSVPTSVITGDIGLSPAAASFVTGFTLGADASNVFSTSTQVVGGGKVYAANFAVPTPSNLTTAILDMQNAYTDAAGRPTPDFLNLASGNIGGLTLTPGLYTWGSSVTIPTDVTISGGANDVWIFQISGNLTMSAAKRITLIGGAQAKNVFWQVAGQATIGTTAHFEGVLLSQTGITLQTGATMNGRALAQSLIALDSATVTPPAP